MDFGWRQGASGLACDGGSRGLGDYAAALFGGFWSAGFQEVCDYFWHGLIVLLGVVAVVGVGLFWIGGRLSGWLKVDEVYQAEIHLGFMIAGLGVVLRLANDFLTNFAMALQRSHIAMAGSSLGGVVSLLSIFLGLVVFGMGVYALVLGLVVRSLVPFCMNFVHTVAMLMALRGRMRWSWPTLRDYALTTPAVLAAKSTTQFAKNLPPVLLTRLIGPEATVAYNVTMRIIQVGQGLINHTLTGLFAACAHFFSDAGVDAAKERSVLQRLSRGFLVSTSVGVLLYALLNQGFVELWAGEAQFAGQLFTSLYGLAAFVTMRGNLFVGLGMSMGHINSFELTQALEYLTQAAVLYYFVGLFGADGVPMAIIASGLIFQFVYHLLLSRARVVVAEALRPLLWFPVLLALGLLGAFYAAPFLKSDSWLVFILMAALVTGPFFGIFVAAMPGVRDQAAARFAGLKRRVTGGAAG